MSFVVTLPWPPSINHYYLRMRSGIIISKKGISYRDLTFFTCRSIDESFINNERLSMLIYAYPPDKRRRDLDNPLKCLLDSLQKAKVYKDDAQIDELHIVRMPDILGKVIVYIKEI